MLKSKAIALPYIIWMLIFTILPIVIIGIYAVTNQSGDFTVSNLSAVGGYMSTIFKSIWLSAIATAICLVIAYPFAFIISRTNPAYQKLYLTLVMLPMWMNFLLRTYAWMTLLENTGLINRLFGIIGIGPFQMINTPGAVVLGMVYNYLPFMILPLYAVMTKIDRSLLHAAQDLGATSSQVFKKVIWPLSMPGVLTGITQVFVPAISTFVISRMLGGGSNLMIGDLIELQFLGSAYNPNLGAAISLGLMVLILFCMTLLNQINGDEKEEMLI